MCLGFHLGMFGILSETRRRRDAEMLAETLELLKLLRVRELRCLAETLSKIYDEIH